MAWITRVNTVRTYVLEKSITTTVRIDEKRLTRGGIKFEYVTITLLSTTEAASFPETSVHNLYQITPLHMPYESYLNFR